MKTIIVILLATVSPFLGAQNWQNICSPGLTLFGDPGHNIASFRQDSVISAPGNSLDSIYWSFCTIRRILNDPNCYDTIFGSVLGNKVYKKVNGTFIFFNYSGDSIFLKTDAGMLQSWKLFSLPNSEYILATVSEIRNDSVCGMPDQIKIITLQAKNAANQNIENIFNNKQMILSRNYGLTRIYDVVKFPNDTTPYILEGKSNPAIGLQDFSIQETFNFDIGDEFHYDFNWGCSLGTFSEKTIKTILFKEVSSTEDTIIYTSERCMQRFSAPPPVYEYIHDTISETVILHENAFYSKFNRQPQEFYPDHPYTIDGFYKNSASFNNRSKKRFYVDYYSKNLTLDCWNYHIYYPHYDYSTGLGHTYYFYQYLYYNEPNSIIVTKQLELVYYRKGTETWGTPLAPDCETLVGIPKSTVTEVPGIIISPNPVLTQAKIEVHGIKPGETNEIILYDYLGREVFHKEIESNPYIFTRDNLPDGFYIVKVIGNSGIFNIAGKVILK